MSRIGDHRITDAVRCPGIDVLKTGYMTTNCSAAGPYASHSTCAVACDENAAAARLGDAAAGLDAAALKRSMIINGISGLCITKLDVLDKLAEIKVCVGYELNGKRIDILPLDADDVAACVPIYDTFPGWSETTFGATSWDALPANARAYLKRVEEVIGAPIDMVSTGPDREHTIVLRHPYSA